MKRLFFIFGSAFSLSFFVLPLAGCARNVDYTRYVSEYRSEIYLAETEGYDLTAFFCAREYPYAADGICAHKENLTEIYLTVPDNTKEYDISFTGADGKTYGGDMSYDGVYARFFYSQSLEPITAPALTFTLTCEGETVVLEAKSVKTGNELTMPEIINRLTEQKQELFESMTEKNSFTGEIRVRLVYNEKCYYYVGVTNTAGQTDSFLSDAYAGTILAERLHD